MSCSILTEYFIYLENNAKNDGKKWGNFSELVWNSNVEMSLKVPLGLKLLQRSDKIERKSFTKAVDYLRTAFDGDKINSEFLDPDFPGSQTGKFPREKSKE